MILTQHCRNRFRFYPVIDADLPADVEVVEGACHVQLAGRGLIRYGFTSLELIRIFASIMARLRP